MAFPKGAQRKGEKAKRPLPSIALNPNQLGEMIIPFRGNLTAIADSLGTTREAVRSTINRHESLKALLAETRERRLDRLEDASWEMAITDGKDSTMKMFLLKTLGRSRGYEMETKEQSLATHLAEAIFNKSKNPVHE